MDGHPLRRHGVASLLLLVCARPDALVAQGTPPAATDPATADAPLTLRGKAFELHYHGATESMATTAQMERALAVVERVWPLVTQHFGAPATPPAAPLAVHLYRTVAGYAAADQELNEGKFRRNLAMAHYGTKSAHVALQPPCTDETLRAIGLPPLTLLLLAWEATHVARYSLCSNFDSHPMWLVDGLASYVAREVTTAEFGRPAAALPFLAAGQITTRSLAQRQALPPLADLFADRIDDLAFSERYAVRATAFAFLADEARGKKLDALLKQTRQLGGGESLAGELARLAQKAFGDQAKPFERHVAALAPEWDEVFRSLGPHGKEGKEWVQIAFAEKNAVAWREEPIRGGLSARGAVRILPADGRQLNFLFGRTGDDFFSLALVADVGWTLFDFHAKDERWERFGSERFPALRLGYRSTFALDVASDALTLRLDDQEWKVPLPRPFPAESRYGLGAQASSQGQETGSAGIWSDLDVRATRSARK